MGEKAIRSRNRGDSPRRLGRHPLVRGDEVGAHHPACAGSHSLRRFRTRARSSPLTAGSRVLLLERRTVCKTVLLLGLRRTHQFPRLFAEVQDGLLLDIVWTNTPPLIDLLRRLLIPAARFRFVPRSLLFREFLLV